MNDDRELLRQYLEQRSERAFTELVQRHVDLVYSVALRQVNGDTQLAEDAVQAVFTALAQKASALRRHPTLTGWLYVSTHHAAAALVRSEQRRRVRETTAQAMQPPLSSRSEPDFTELRPVLDEALVTLRPAERDALVLRFFEQRSFADIAAALRTSEEAARKRVDRALEKIRAVLRQRGVTSSSATVAAALGAFAITAAPTKLAAQVAATAVAKAGAGASGATFGVILKVAPTVTAIVAATWLLTTQSQHNAALRADRDVLRAAVAEASALRAGNEVLRRQLNDVAALRAAATIPPAPAPNSTPPPGHVRPAFAHVRITPENTIEWNGTGVTLADFIHRLNSAGSDPALAESRLVVRAPNPPFSVLSFVLDEACKAQVPHVVIESDSRPVPGAGVDTWF